MRDLRSWLAGLSFLGCASTAPAPTGEAGRLTAPAPTLGAPSQEGPALLVAELFTSEGCSSCPPADETLARLAEEAPPGVELIALGLHVDYWDDLGWKDPYSRAEYTTRQSEYQRALGQRSSYTPQLVVNGSHQALGSVLYEVTRALSAASEEPAQRLGVVVTRPDERALRAEVSIPEGLREEGPASLWIALTERNLESQVTRGENRGKRLHHAPTVRTLRRVPRGGAGGTVTLTLEPTWRGENVRVVAILQRDDTRRIIGAAEVPL